MAPEEAAFSRFERPDSSGKPPRAGRGLAKINLPQRVDDAPLPLVRQLQQVPLTRELLARTERPERLRLGGAGRAGRALISSALAGVAGAPLLVVVPTLEEAGRWAALLELMGWDSCQLYPTSEGSPYEPFDPTSEITWGQLQVLAELLDPESGGRRLAIVASERALQPHLPPPAVLAGRCLTLRRGDTLDLEELGATLARLGYERVPTIEQEGTWSRRGDIIDLFPVSAELPVRLELFGEELEKLREFDPSSQRSLDAIQRVRLTPTSHAPLIAEALRETMPSGLERLLAPEALDQLLEGGTPEGMRRLLGLAWQEPASLLDYLPAGTLVALEERRHALAHGQQWFDHAASHHQEVLQELALESSPTGGLSRASAAADRSAGGTPAPTPLLPASLHRPPPRPWRPWTPFSASTWPNCRRATDTPTASIWPAGRCQPTPMPSAAWPPW